MILKDYQIEAIKHFRKYLRGRKIIKIFGVIKIISVYLYM